MVGRIEAKMRKVHTLQKEKDMGTIATLERPAIEDTLFGEPRVLDAHAENGPDGCFCICRCATGDAKIQNNSNTTVDMACGVSVP